MGEYADEYGELFGEKQNKTDQQILSILERIGKIEDEVFCNRVPIPLKRLHPDAIVPQYAHEDDAGFDFFALVDKSIPYILVEPNNQKIVPTGWACSIQYPYEIQIRPKSGLSFKFKIIITNTPGTIDAGYTGEIKIIIYNLSDTSFSIRHGDKIAQGVLGKVFKAVFQEVDELPKTDRGEGGFGSTGK